MKTFRCSNCGDEYQLMHICLKKPENNEIVCQECGRPAREHSNTSFGVFSMCEKSKTDVVYEYHFSPTPKVDNCPDCGHETKKHGSAGCLKHIQYNGYFVYCPCNKPHSEIPYKPEIQESGINCPDCGCDVNLHSDVDGNDYAVMDYYGCNNHKGTKSVVCSCNLKFETALNKAVEYAGSYSAKATALKENYERNKKPEPQTCVMCDEVFTRSKDIEAGTIMASPGHSMRFVCESCCMFIHFAVRNREER